MPRLSPAIPARGERRASGDEIKRDAKCATPQCSERPDPAHDFHTRRSRAQVDEDPHDTYQTDRQRGPGPWSEGGHSSRLRGIGCGIATSVQRVAADLRCATRREKRTRLRNEELRVIRMVTGHISSSAARRLQASTGFVRAQECAALRGLTRPPHHGKGQRVANRFRSRCCPLRRSTLRRTSDVVSGFVARDGKTLRVLVRAEQP